MRKTVLVALFMALALPAVAAALPVPSPALLSIDRKAGNRNFLPTRMLPSFEYASWSYGHGVLRVHFRSKAGRRIDWTVAPMAGGCDSGKQKSFQLAGNKVWWAESRGVQRAWRCVFGQDGRALRISASSRTTPTKLADVGLGRVVASGKRY